MIEAKVPVPVEFLLAAEAEAHVELAVGDAFALVAAWFVVHGEGLEEWEWLVYMHLGWGQDGLLASPSLLRGQGVPTPRRKPDERFCQPSEPDRSHRPALVNVVRRVPSLDAGMNSWPYSRQPPRRDRGYLVRSVAAVLSP